MAGNQNSGEGNAKNRSLRMEVSVGEMRRVAVSLWLSVWKLGREDPRRVVHALKVGLALALVSLLYLLEPLFEEVGQNAMWAVMTVVVVLEFTAGATLCKGLNRGFGTLCAGSLAFFVEFVAETYGKAFRATFIGTSVFLIGFIATFLRFFPHIKKNYDYGVVIFLLTFNLITVSSFRDQNNVIHIATVHLYTIAIGCGICLLTSLLIFPNWSGEDLQNSTTYKLEGLARSIEACVDEYFQDKELEIMGDKSSKDSIYEGYRAILDSKSSDEALALFASWEPRHSRHCNRYPWQQYVKLGAVLRHFGYIAVALHGCLESEVQTPRSVRSLFQDPCIRVAREVSKVLAELASSIKNHHRCSPNVLSDHLHEALQDLNSAIKSQPRLFLGSNTTKLDKDSAMPSVMTDVSASLELQDNHEVNKSKELVDRKLLRPTLSKIAIASLEFSDALPVAAFASMLVEMVAKLELVIEEVEELGKAANFKEFSGIVVSCDGKVQNGSARDLEAHVVSQFAD